MLISETVSYTDQGAQLEGFVAYPSQEKRPTVILCHAWAGRDDFICKKATLLAEWGYVGFAIDLYGKGVIGKSKEESKALKQPFLNDRIALQRRLLKSLEVVQGLPFVDTDRIVALGFGFGGLCALDLARSGADLRGAISVYGHFDRPQIAVKKPIRAKVLILHGCRDPIVPMNDLIGFEKEMLDAQADWQAHLYGSAMHGFTNPQANDPSSGIAYDPIAEKLAWRQIEDFLKNCFRK